MYILFANCILVGNAAHTFYNAQTNVAENFDGKSTSIRTQPLNITINPEEKRKIIGDTFMTVICTQYTLF